MNACYTRVLQRAKELLMQCRVCGSLVCVAVLIHRDWTERGHLSLFHTSMHTPTEIHSDYIFKPNGSADV